MPVAAKHFAVQADEAIDIERHAFLDLFGGEIERSGRREMRRHADVHCGVAVVDARDRRFAKDVLVQVAFSPTAEVVLWTRSHCPAVF